MNRSDQINELAAALAKAQGEMKAPTKNKTAKIATKSGGSYSYKYSDLADTIEAGKPLSANGLSITQIINMSPTLHLEGVLMHSSGQWISSTYPLTFNGTPQEFGSQLTYARRYQISCLLGIAADEDDDGAAAEGIAKSKAQRPAPVVAEDHKPTPPAAPTQPATNGTQGLRQIVADASNKQAESAPMPVSDMGITEIRAEVDQAIKTSRPLSPARAADMWARVAGAAKAAGLTDVIASNKATTNTPAATVEHYTRNIADAVMKAAQPA